MPIIPNSELNQHLAQLKNEHCAHFSAKTPNIFNNAQAQAVVLYALTQSYPRPLSLWRIIQDGLPEHGLDKQTTQYALMVLQQLRLLRVRRTNQLFLTRSGEALTPHIIAHFHSVH